MAKITGEDGWVLLGNKVTISNITVNNPLSVTILTGSNHGLVSDDIGNYVYIQGVASVSGLNGLRKVTNVTGNTTLTVQTESASGSYTGDTDYLQRAFKITGWSLNQESEVKDVTDSESADNAKEFIPAGFVAWSGSFACFFENDTVRGAPYLQKGEVLDIRLCLTDAEDDEYFDGDCVITEEADVLEVAGTNAVKATFQFQGTDTLTKS